MLTGAVDFHLPDVESMKQLWADPQHFEAIIDYMPGNVYWKDYNGIYCGCNLNTVNFFGFSTKDQVIGKTDYDLLDPRHAERMRQNDIRIMSDGKAELLEEFDPDHPEIDYLSYKLPMRNKKGKIIGIVGISFDISHRKQQEINLQKEKERVENTLNLGQVSLAKMAEEVTGQKASCDKSAEEYVMDMRDYLEKIIACMPGNVYWKNREGKLLGANKNALKYFGATSIKELIGKTDYDLLDKKTADLVTKIDTEVMETGKPIYNVEEPAFRKRKMIYLTQKVPLYNSAGNVIGLVGVSFDITERKHMEKEIQESKTREKVQNERMLAMQSIAASLAHELRTPLTTISNNTDIKEFLRELITGYDMAKKAKLSVPFIRPSQLDGIREGLDSIQREADHASKVITMLLTNLKELETATDDFEEFYISEVIEESLKRYSFSSQKHAKLIKTDVENNFLVEGKALLVTHVLFNLIKNALHFIEEAGRGEITIMLMGGKKINKLYFTDTGTGINKEALPHIFEHFFSKTDTGTGIGLSFCKMAMQNMGGNIACDSKEGEYTRFTLTFPAVRKA